MPPDYEANKKEIADLKEKIAQLERKLEEPAVEVIPEDYEQTKKELARLKTREENFREEVATSQALNQFFMMANFLEGHKEYLPEVLKGYLKTDEVTPKRINQIAFVSALLKKFSTKKIQAIKKVEENFGISYTYFIAKPKYPTLSVKI